MNITQDAANHAADMIDGIVSHPFWGGIDKEALATVRDALRSGSVTIGWEDDRDEPLPDWGLPGDEMEYTGKGGYDAERQHADTIFEKGQSYIIAATEIGGWSSSYEIQGIKGSFNTCLFTYANPAAVQSDWDIRRDGRKAELNACSEHGDLFDDD